MSFVCAENFHCNKPLRIIRMMLPGRKGCRGMSKIDGIKVEPLPVRCGLGTNQVEVGGHVMPEIKRRT